MTCVRNYLICVRDFLTCISVYGNLLFIYIGVYRNACTCMTMHKAVGKLE